MNNHKSMILLSMFFFPQITHEKIIIALNISKTTLLLKL
jgi:hypothetical protein